MQKPQQDIQHWIRRITESEMPIFGRTVQEIISVSQDDVSSAIHLGQVVLKDPAMTSRVLKLANSAFYNSTGHKISTVSRAILMLGFEAVRAMCLTVALVDSLVQGIHREHLVQEMARSLHAATQARLVAEKTGDKAVEEVFIATLLMHIGDLAFWCFSGEIGERLDALMRRQHLSPDEAQRQLLGFTLDELSQGLAKEWSLGDLLCNSLKAAGRDDPRARVVRWSHDFARAVEQGWDIPPVRKLTEQLAKLESIPTEQATGQLKEATRLAVEATSHYGARSVAQVIPLPGNVKSELEDVDEVPQFPEPDPQLQLQIMRELTLLTREKADFNIVIEMALEGMHRGVGLDRVLFALKTPDHRHIRAKQVIGSDKDWLHDHFRFDLLHSGSRLLWKQVMGASSSLWFDDDHAKTWTGVHSHFQNRVGAERFFVSAVQLKGQTIGLFYADRALSKRALDQDGYDSFLLFGQQANLVLDQLSSRKR